MASLGVATVGVMGSGSNEYPELAEPLGALLAALELNLLTGAGRGVMTSVSRAYCRARAGRGISIGIVRCESAASRDRPKEGSPNPFVELPIYTHLPASGSDGMDDLSRNHINVLSSNLIVALPGNAGTASELALALRYRRPAVVFKSASADTAHFPAAVPQTCELDEVEAFIRHRIDVDGSSE